jgi:hypothetical protein
MASRLQAAVTRLTRFESQGPPQLAPKEQNVKMRLRGGRTGKRAVVCEKLVLTGNTRSFGLESYQGTVITVTHDRWFARSFERFLIFTPDGSVREATEPVWD